MNSRNMRWKEARRRAGRTFLQTACGVLFAGILSAVTGWTGQIPGWKLGLLTLIASATAAGIAAVMNVGSGEASGS